MLTAIQDFVRDSITGAESEDLKTVRAGESSVVLAYAPDAIVAGFVRGVVPRHLNRLFQDELDAIQETETEALAGFSGDVSVFDHLQPRLRRCLTGKGDGLDQGRSATRAAKALVFGVPALLLCVLAALWFFDARAGRRWQQAIARLDSEPGIVVTDSSRRGSRAFIAGMRDPLAADPAGILRQTGVDAAVIDFRWKEYLSLEPRLAAQRAYREAREQIERQGLRFPAGSAKIPPEQQYVVEQAASRLRTLFGAAAATHRHVTIEIEGGTDPSGAEKLNAELAGQRASAVQSALVAGGVERERLRTRGAPGSCPAASEADRALCRKVLFRVLEAAPKP
jgi:outer membrane protein OmpA-like peptidoglycan-associated protein